MNRSEFDALPENLKNEIFEKSLGNGLIPFLTKAYHMPAEVHAALIDKFDDVDTRNKATIALLFDLYLVTYEGHEFGKSIEDGAATLSDELFHKFLAKAVLLTYCGF